MKLSVVVRAAWEEGECKIRWSLVTLFQTVCETKRPKTRTRERGERDDDERKARAKIINQPKTPYFLVPSSIKSQLTANPERHGARREPSNKAPNETKSRGARNRIPKTHVHSDPQFSVSSIVRGIRVFVRLSEGSRTISVAFSSVLFIYISQ